MPLIIVAGSERGAGATTVTVGLAHRLAYAGHTVHVARLAGDARAEGDARTLASLEFADGSGAPVTPEAIAAAAAAAAVTVAEAPAGADLGRLAAIATRLLVVAAVGAGPGLILNHQRHAGPRALPEDRLLAAPTVGDLTAASHARVLARSAAGDAAICEHIVIGAIAHDSDQPYFARFPRKAVVTRAEKVDVALSALRTDTECLILTGGADPSPYLLDRVAAARATTLLVAPEGTVETVREIEGTFGRSPFAGAAKVERVGALMARALDAAALAALLAPRG